MDLACGVSPNGDRRCVPKQCMVMRVNIVHGDVDEVWQSKTRAQTAKDGDGRKRMNLVCHDVVHDLRRANNARTNSEGCADGPCL